MRSVNAGVMAEQPRYLDHVRPASDVHRREAAQERAMPLVLAVADADTPSVTSERDQVASLLDQLNLVILVSDKRVQGRISSRPPTGPPSYVQTSLISIDRIILD
jgi:hypothetical protein